MARKTRAAAGGTEVRTTFNPHEVITVGDAELLDLKRQGLLYEGTPTEPAAADEVDEDKGEQ